MGTLLSVIDIVALYNLDFRVGWVLKETGGRSGNLLKRIDPECIKEN